MAIQLVIGLGNPGNDYAQTRHNIGFWFIEQLCNQQAAHLQAENRFFGYSAKTQIAGHDIRLLCPTTFMNRSGQSVGAMARFFQIPSEDILIVHDDLDLSVGEVRFKKGGGHGGHNGLRHITPQIGADFTRLRLGIGHPGHKSQVSNYVLSKPSAADAALMHQCIDHALAHLPLILAGQFDLAMNKINAFKPSGSI